MFGAGVARRLLSNRCGAVAVMAAIILPAVLGTAGFGLDVGYWYLTKRNFQGAADAAAISAAIAYGSGNVAGYVTEARTAAAQHGATHAQNGIDVSVTFPYADGTAACPAGNGDCLQVQIAQAQSPMLARLVGLGDLTVAAQSVAQISHPTYCMLALDQGNVTGIDWTMAGVLNMPNCSIGVNSTGGSAFTLNGSLVFLTAYTATVAGSFNNSCFICFLTWTHPIKTNAGAPYTPITDPYRLRTVPAPAVPIQPQGIPQIPGNCQAPITASQTVNSGANNCYKGVNLVANSNATVTFNAGNYTIYGITLPDTTTLTLNAGNYAIYGQAGKVAISVTGGTLTLGSGNHTIVGPANESAISVTGGTLTINGSGSSIIDIFGGSGQPAIAVTGGSFTLGDGNSNIQAGSSNVSAITLAGSGNFTTVDNTNGTGVVIGPTSPTTYAITVNTNSTTCGFGFGSCSGHDLTLGAGTYTIMGGINVFPAVVGGGNVTLNPNGTSIGTYIIDGGGGTCNGHGANVGLCQTFGDLNGQNATIVLTGPGSTYATTYTQGADGLNLTAPQNGPTAGLAMFQCSTGPRPCTASVGSNTTVGLNFLTVTGALYFPAQDLNFVGAIVDLNNTCLQLIANRITIQGLAFIDDQCPAGVSPIGIGSVMASLVE
jgi:hypothetical protein